MDIDKLLKQINLADYCRFAFVKITYSGWIEGEFVEKNIIVVMN